MDAALELMWSKYRGCAHRALTIRGGLDQWRSYSLALTVAGALLATSAAQLSPGLPVAARILSAVSALAMALAGWSARSMLDPKAEKDWIRTRALAERAKSEAYRYATRVPHYADDDPSAKLLEKVKELLKAGGEVPAAEVKGDDARKGLPGFPLSVHDYVTVRIGGHVQGFFEPKAAANERNAVRWTRLVQILSAGAAILGVLGATQAGAGFEAWVTTISAVSSAIGTYALAQRYQRLAATYRLAADRLKWRLVVWQVATQKRADSEADKALILDAEEILNGENEAWVADYLKHPTTPPKEKPG